MNKKLLISLFLAISSFSFSNDNEPNQFHAQVELVQSLAVKVESDLNYGNIIAGTSNNYPVQKGRVKILGVPYTLINLQIKIKNQSIHNQSGSRIPLKNKYNDTIYTRVFYDFIQGYPYYSTGDKESILSNENGIIEMVIDGYIHLPSSTKAGNYSQTLVFVARYD
ncbi:MAG: hypothetical protein Q7K48_04395 [Fusobacterium sp. JB021]|nr:hypothetical protein [Fusobacterium sp. JB020]MDP0493516.1 hypothetical protein [Fusobacterium sp. JB021]MDP0505857.1 hypothetical protein [Fusobacterium sp. JB019]